MTKILLNSVAAAALVFGAPLVFGPPAAFAQSTRMHSGDKMAQTSDEHPDASRAKSEHAGAAEESRPQGTTPQQKPQSATAQSNEERTQSGSEEGRSQTGDQNKGTEPARSGKQSAAGEGHKSDSKAGRSEHSSQTDEHPGKSSASEEQHHSNEAHGVPNGEAHGRRRREPQHASTTNRSESKSPTAGEKTKGESEAAQGHSGEHAEAGGEHGTADHKLDTSQQQRVREAIRTHHVTNITHADFSVHVGTVVPDHYHFYPLPDDIVSIVPEYRGYDYMVVDDEVVIIEPRTHRIVYTLPENQAASFEGKSVNCR